MYNPKRGDVSLTLTHPDGRQHEYVLRPSWEAQAAIEDRSSSGNIYIMVQAFRDGTPLSFRDSAAIFWAGHNAYLNATGQQGSQITYERACELLHASGIASWLMGISKFMLNCVAGPEAQKESEQELKNELAGD